MTTRLLQEPRSKARAVEARAHARRPRVAEAGKMCVSFSLAYEPSASIQRASGSFPGASACRRSTFWSLQAMSSRSVTSMALSFLVVGAGLTPPNGVTRRGVVQQGALVLLAPE